MALHTNPQDANTWHKLLLNSFCWTAVNMGSEELSLSRLLNVVWAHFKGEGLNKESEDLEPGACSWELKVAKLDNTSQHKPLLQHG